MSKEKLHPDLQISFSEILRAIREDVGITASELAKRSGVTRSYISFLETERAGRPSEDVVIAIAKALNIDSSWLCLVAGRCPEEFMIRFLNNPKKACEVVRKWL